MPNPSNTSTTKPITRRWGFWVASVIVGFTVLGALINILDPEGMERIRQEREAAKAKEASEPKERPEPPKPTYLWERDGLAITHFDWKQQDSSQLFTYNITYLNTGSSDIDGADLSYMFVYTDGDSSLTYTFSFPVGRFYDKKELKEGESFPVAGKASIPHSWNYHKKIKEVRLEILDVD
jgi:hypothetical protein